MRFVLGVAFFAVVVGATQVGACGSNANEETAALADAGEGSKKPTSPSTQPPWDAGLPPGVPVGWALYTDYDPSCRFYYPTDKKYLPEPATWEPCSTRTGDAGISGPSGIDCRVMAIPWKGIQGGPGTLTIRSVDVQDGRALMLVDRVMGTSGFQLVAEADGPVRNGLFNSGVCLTSGRAEARFGNVIQRVFDADTASTTAAGGAIGGPIDTLKPRVYFPKGHKPSTLYSQDYAVGRNYFIEMAVPDKVYTFATGELVATLSPTGDDADLFYSRYHFQGDEMFWVANSSIRSKVKLWTKADGVRTLLDHGTDLTRVIAGFSTDGVDMVWLEGVGRTNTNVLSFDAYEHWTAKYSTDSATLNATKRRLRSEMAGSYGYYYAVGCGYAAIHVYGPYEPGEQHWGRGGFRLIRLSDGVSWLVTDDSVEKSKQLAFDAPLAVTCDEVFLRGFSNTFKNQEVVRIRIDSLGPGIPAD